MFSSMVLALLLKQKIYLLGVIPKIILTLFESLSNFNEYKSTFTKLYSIVITTLSITASLYICLFLLYICGVIGISLLSISSYIMITLLGVSDFIVYVGISKKMVVLLWKEEKLNKIILFIGWIQLNKLSLIALFLYSGLYGAELKDSGFMSQDKHGLIIFFYFLYLFSLTLLTVCSLPSLEHLCILTLQVLHSSLTVSSVPALLLSDLSLPSPSPGVLAEPVPAESSVGSQRPAEVPLYFRRIGEMFYSELTTREVFMVQLDLRKEQLSKKRGSSKIRNRFKVKAEPQPALHQHRDNQEQLTAKEKQQTGKEIGMVIVPVAVREKREGGIGEVVRTPITLEQRKMLKETLQSSQTKMKVIEKRKANMHAFDITRPISNNNWVPSTLKKELMDDCSFISEYTIKIIFREKLEESESESSNYSSNKGKPELIKEDDDSNACNICFMKKANAVLLPCNHGGFCRDCVLGLFKVEEPCPLCRSVLSSSKSRKSLKSAL